MQAAASPRCHMILVGVAVGSLSALLGIYLSYYLDLASGAAIFLVATTLFFVTLASLVTRESSPVSPGSRRSGGPTPLPPALLG